VATGEVVEQVCLHRASITPEDANERVTTRNNEYEKPCRSKAFRTFSQVSSFCDFGLITRRSRVQIPPPLRMKALVRAISGWGLVVLEVGLLTDLSSVEVGPTSKILISVDGADCIALIEKCKGFVTALFFGLRGGVDDGPHDQGDDRDHHKPTCQSHAPAPTSHVCPSAGIGKDSNYLHLMYLPSGALDPNSYVLHLPVTRNVNNGLTLQFAERSSRTLTVRRLSGRFTSQDSIVTAPAMPAA